jgi:hypothetical protein
MPSQDSRVDQYFRVIHVANRWRQDQWSSQGRNCHAQEKHATIGDDCVPFSYQPKLSNFSVLLSIREPQRVPNARKAVRFQGPELYPARWI